MPVPTARARSGHHLAVDIGGTFTDLVGIDGATGRLVLAKVPTTPDRLEDGVIDAVGQSGVDPASVAGFVHGTTAVINAITERTGAITALITTRGFRDVLEIGRRIGPTCTTFPTRSLAPSSHVVFASR